MITANAHTPAVRLRSYDLIADAYGFPKDIAAADAAEEDGAKDGERAAAGQASAG